MSHGSMDFDEVMDNTLIRFAQDLLKQGQHTKQEVTQWIKDRFHKNGSLRVMKYDTDLFVHDESTSNVFSLQPYQVYNISDWDKADINGKEIRLFLKDMPFLELIALETSMELLAGRKSLVLWKLYRPLSASDMVAAYGLATSTPTTAGVTESMTCGVPVAILCHHMVALLNMGVLSYYGHQCNDAYDSQRVSGSN